MLAVYSGIDQLREADHVLQGKRVGLMTNQTGVDSHFRTTIDLLNEAYSLTVLFSVEHGIRGDVQAGEHYDEVMTDAVTGKPVYAVYGKTRRLTDEMLETFDVLCFDIQDVGARFYTYLYALSFAMEECARADKEIVVFDRLNPLGGDRIEGPVLEERLASYVGMYALPTRYGLTIGEYALWVRDHLSLNTLKLTVVPLKGWKRSCYLDECSIPWIAPSPNCAAFHTALAYIGTCVFEGTNVSEGRGTTLSFEYIGAPWINAPELEAAMGKHVLPGLHFRAAYFTPTFSKYAGEACRGVQIHITDRHSADIVQGGLTLLDEIRRMYPDRLTWNRFGDGPYTIDRLLGTDSYRLGQHDAASLIQAHEPARRAFAEEKQKYHLYD